MQVLQSAEIRAVSGGLFEDYFFINDSGGGSGWGDASGGSFGEANEAGIGGTLLKIIRDGIVWDAIKVVLEGPGPTSSNLPTNTGAIGYNSVNGSDFMSDSFTAGGSIGAGGFGGGEVGGGS